MGDGLQAAFDVLGIKYRQSVLNDFSIVSKAKFYIVKQEEKGGIKMHTCEKFFLCK